MLLWKDSLAFDGGNMELIKYQEKDSAVICSWIKDEKSLYQWSANRIGRKGFLLSIEHEQLLVFQFMHIKN